MAWKYMKDGKFFSVPEALFYVLSNDTGLSNWTDTKGKINTCVVPCDSLEEAKKIEQYVSIRNDQTKIRIINKQPRLKDHVVYFLMTEWKKIALER